MQVEANSKDFKGDGQCLCGSVQYMITGEPIYSVACHCTKCRRSTGTSFVTNMIFYKKVASLLGRIIPRSRSYTSKWRTSSNVSNALQDLSWQQLRDEALRCFEDKHTDTGKPLMRHFWQYCGSPIFAMISIWDKIVSIFAGTLNDQQAWNPMKEQYCDSKAPWLPDLGITDRQKRGPGTEISL